MTTLTSSVIRARIEHIVFARSTRTWADRISTPAPVVDDAVELAVAWIGIAEARGVSLEDLDGVSDVACAALDAIRARDFRLIGGAR